MEKKLNRAIKCLKILAGVEFVVGLAVLAYLIIVVTSIEMNATSVVLPIVLSIVLALIGGLIFAIYKVIQGLQEGKFGAWIGAIILLALSLGSLLFPVSIVGLIAICSEEVRSVYLNRQTSMKESLS